MTVRPFPTSSGYSLVSSPDQILRWNSFLLASKKEFRSRALSYATVGNSVKMKRTPADCSEGQSPFNWRFLQQEITWLLQASGYLCDLQPPTGPTFTGIGWSTINIQVAHLPCPTSYVSEASRNQGTAIKPAAFDIQNSQKQSTAAPLITEEPKTRFS